MHTMITVPLLTASGLQGFPSLDADPEWPLAAEASFGSIDDPETALSRIIDAAIDPTGHLVLAQLYDLRVGIYDANGRRVGSVGRPGNGPQDLGSIQAVGVRGDTIWVTDGRAASLKFFLRDGTCLGSTTAVKSLGGGILAKAGYPLTTGHVLALNTICRDGNARAESGGVGGVEGHRAARRGAEASATQTAPGPYRRGCARRSVLAGTRLALRRNRSPAGANNLSDPRGGPFLQGFLARTLRLSLDASATALQRREVG